MMLLFHLGPQLHRLSFFLCTTIAYLYYTLLKIMSLKSYFQFVDHSSPTFVISSNDTNKCSVAPWKHKQEFGLMFQIPITGYQKLGYLHCSSKQPSQCTKTCLNEKQINFHILCGEQSWLGKLRQGCYILICQSSKSKTLCEDQPWQTWFTQWASITLKPAQLPLSRAL